MQLEEAHSLIATMLADEAKKVQPLVIASSMKGESYRGPT
jgi:hypothetical protein